MKIKFRTCFILGLNLICSRNSFEFNTSSHKLLYPEQMFFWQVLSSDTVCNVSLTESISHLEPGVFVFDCGKWLSYFFIMTYCNKELLLIIKFKENYFDFKKKSVSHGQKKLAVLVGLYLLGIKGSSFQLFETKTIQICSLRKVKLHFKK